MDIEQMRIRMGEMAAEIERLQSIVNGGSQNPIFFARRTFRDADGIECGTYWTKMDNELYELNKSEEGDFVGMVVYQRH